jgi:hypothetical protein
MPRTAFDPKEHGFAFINWWVMDEAERQRLYDTFATFLKWAPVVGAATFGLTGLVLVPRSIVAVRKNLESDMARGYGLCGGMCFTALDFYKAAHELPRGAGRTDQPVPGNPVRSTIWKRQLDSLFGDAARFLAWLIILNHIPPGRLFGGGPGWLLARSREEWEKLTKSVDAGEPVPIGLVRETADVFQNHQVLAIGYEQEDEVNRTIYVYDPNCPDVESKLSLQFGPDHLDGRETCGAPPPLRGFFCETYSPSPPPF